jgi:hypothetical protein
VDVGEEGPQHLGICIHIRGDLLAVEGEHQFARLLFNSKRVGGNRGRGEWFADEDQHRGKCDLDDVHAAPFV